MMKNPAKILFLGMLLFFAGCVTLYKPNVIHSPLLKEKGDVKTSAMLGLYGSGLINLQAAYAISDHTGVMMDGMYHNRGINRGDTSVNRLNIFFGEVGVGYFSLFGNDKKSLFQCYGGGGFGFSSDKTTNSTLTYPDLSAKYINIFVQPGVAYFNNDFEMAFDMRVNSVYMFNINGYLYDKFEWWDTSSNLYTDSALFFMNIEPVVTIKVGDKLKGILQLGITIPVINSDDYFKVNNASQFILPLFKFSLGVNYTFGKK